MSQKFPRQLQQRQMLMESSKSKPLNKRLCFSPDFPREMLKKQIISGLCEFAENRML